MSVHTGSTEITNPAPSKKKPPTAWIIAGVIALIVAIAAIVAITSSGDDGDETAPAASAPGAADSDADDGEADTDVTLDDTGSGDDTTTPITGVPTPVEIGTSVVVSGQPLPARDDTGDPAIGVQAPVISGIGFDGSPRSIVPGKPTLIVFVAHWCPHCQREIPRLVEWSADGGVPEGVDVVGIATGTDESRDNYPPSEWLEREEWEFPVVLDDEASTAGIAMGIDAYPFFVLLDASGKVVLRDSGELDTDDLTERIETALAG